MFTQPRRSTQPTKLHPLQRTRQRTRKFLIGANFCVGGGGGGWDRGQSLPFPLPRSPASRTFVSLCLPTPALHYVAPVFRLINPGFLWGGGGWMGQGVRVSRFPYHVLPPPVLLCPFASRLPPFIVLLLSSG